ncbi:PREDICTED: kallikrein-4-like [Chinchilla lanigera]|uniref:kallikrein-4-like n=1 Tax=Chinchilla lanigera TaxID=34839 RepID=UPI000697F332|nr:PREDICTED: kallikrein-4-like [Chinchilla lanigera]
MANSCPGTSSVTEVVEFRMAAMMLQVAPEQDELCDRMLIPGTVGTEMRRKVQQQTNGTRIGIYSMLMVTAGRPRIQEFTAIVSLNQFMQDFILVKIAGVDMGTTAEVLWLCFLGCIIHTAAEAEIPLKRTGNHFANEFPVLIKRISGGLPCIPHSQPWIAALFDDHDAYCAGVLVHPQWVLSAAHCWNTSYTIGLGLHGLFDWFESSSQIIEANFSVKHPQYITPSNGNDLMLIKLNRPVVESDTIRTIRIASRCPRPGTRCRISGWGQLLNGYYPSDLQCAIIPVVSKQYCKYVLRSKYHDSMFCAGTQGYKDACPADSGGPVVCNGVLQGLVSFGFKPCGQPGVPSVYTNLCKFKDWINEIIRTR